MQKEKKLYSTKSINNIDEFVKLNMQFPKMAFLYFARMGTIAVLLLMIFVFIIIKNRFLSLLIFAVCEGIVLLCIRLTLKSLLKVFYKRQIHKHIITENMCTYYDFYEEYLIVKKDVETLKINYNDVDNFIVTEQNIYFKRKNTNLFFSIQISKDDKKLVNFFKNKVCQQEIINKPIQAEKNNKIVNTLMIVLLVLSVCSILLINIVSQLITKFYSIEELPLLPSTLSYLILIFIPLITTIVGLIYNLKGFDSKKNIIVGICITLYFIIMIGMSIFNSIMANSVIGYSEIIKNYQNIINLDLPNEGYVKYDSGYFIKDNYKITYNVTIIDYNKVDTSELLLNMKESREWFISNKIENQLMDSLIPNTKLNDSNYLLFYNKTKNEYNKAPSGSEMQEIYFMKYNIKNKKLIIYEYLYTK